MLVNVSGGGVEHTAPEVEGALADGKAVAHQPGAERGLLPKQ